MANFYINDTTTAGESLLADVIGRGGVFTPTRMVVGSGNMPAGTAAADMAALVKQEASFSINKKKRMPEQSNALIGGAFTNRDVMQGFTLKEIGIYAKAVYADGTESSEVLYSYGNAGDQGDYIPAYSTSTVVERQIDIATYIGAEATVNLTVESQVYVSVAAHEALEASLAETNRQMIEDKEELMAAIGSKSDMAHKHSTEDTISGIFPIVMGGTGAKTAAGARDNLSVYGKTETYSKGETYSKEETYSKKETLNSAEIMKLIQVSERIVINPGESDKTIYARRCGTLVEVSGFFQSYHTGIIGTLPIEYRPGIELVVAVTGLGSDYGYLKINKYGEITVGKMFGASGVGGSRQFRCMYFK